MVLPRKRRIWAYYLQNQSIRLFHSGAGKAGGCWKAIQGTPFPLPSGPKTLHSKHSHPLQQGISHLLKRNQNTVKKKKKLPVKISSAKKQLWCSWSRSRNSTAHQRTSCSDVCRMSFVRLCCSHRSKGAQK